MDMQQFVKERADALRSRDKQKIQKYMKKYRVNFCPSNETVFWAAVHKAIISINSATAEEKERSARWLLEHGFYPGLSMEADHD